MWKADTTERRFTDIPCRVTFPEAKTAVAFDWDLTGFQLPIGDNAESAKDGWVCLSLLGFDCPSLAVQVETVNSSSKARHFRFVEMTEIQCNFLVSMAMAASVLHRIRSGD